MTAQTSPSPLPVSAAFVMMWLSVLIVIAAHLRVHGADGYYYNADDMQHISIAKGATLSQVLQFALHETHPPVGHILRHYWLLMGDSQFLVRGFSLLFGLVLIPLYYLIGSFAGGRLAGLICATLMTFSFGCIIQSYVVRNYTVFLFLLSFGFYCFLHWRKNRGAASMLGYGIFGTLSCLTHFSGIFAVLAIAVCECFCLYQQKNSVRAQAHWAITNCLILCIATYVYYYWQAALAHRVLHKTFIENHELLWFALAYPVNMLYYILPSKFFAIALLAFFPLLRKSNDGRLRFFLILVAIATSLGMALVASGLYPFGGSRHSLWILPFVLPTASLMLANAFRLMTEKYAAHTPRSLFMHGIMFILCIIGMALYSPALRFADTSEYTITNDEWQDVTKALSALGPHDLIVSERSDAGFLVSPYEHLNSSYEGAVVSYASTRLLFRVDYMHYDGDTLIHLLQDARDRHELDDVDTLVFFRTAASRSAIINLTLCAALDKQIITIPVDQELLASPATLLLVSKRVFFDEAVNPSGKAHSCLNPSIVY